MPTPLVMATARLVRAARIVVGAKQRQKLHLMRREVSRELSKLQLEETERQLTIALTPYFAAQIDSAQKKLTAHSELQNPGEDAADRLVRQIFNPQQWEDELVTIALPILAEQMSEVAIAYFLSLGIDIRKDRPARPKSTATDWLARNQIVPPPGVSTEMPEWMQVKVGEVLRETFKQDYWEEVPVTTRDNIRTYLNDGITNGWSVQRMAKEMADRFEGYDVMRATRVARTESGNALNGAQNAAYEGLKEQLPEEVSQHINKEWISVLGNTTRDDHANLDGTLADEEGLFNLAGTQIPWPAHWSLPAGQRANCQCTLGTAFGSDMPPAEELEQVLSQDDPQAAAAELAAAEPEEEAPRSIDQRIAESEELEDIAEQVLKVAREAQDETSAAWAAFKELDKQSADASAEYFRVLRAAHEHTQEEVNRVIQQSRDLREQRDAALTRWNETKARREQRIRQAMAVPEPEQMRVLSTASPAIGKIGWGDTVKPSKEFRTKLDAASAFASSLVRKQGYRDFVSVNAYQLKASKTNRAFAMNGRVSGIFCAAKNETAVFAHELGHRLEVELGASWKCREFRDYRVRKAGTPDVSMVKATGIKSYEAHEVGNEDDFGKAFDSNSKFYIGKTYSDGQTEVLSMGIEKLYFDPVGFAHYDREYFKFTLGVLRGVL